MQWEKNPGDHVELDDVVAVIETDKVLYFDCIIMLGKYGCPL